MKDLIAAVCEEPPRSEPRRPSDLQRYIVARFNGGAGPTWLDSQDIDQAVRATEMLGGLLVYGPEQSAASMTSEMWDEAARAAWPLVANGQKALSEFLVDALAHHTKSDGSPSPRKAFGMLYRWLAATRSSKNPGPIRGLLREAIFENVPLVPGQVLLGEAVLKPRLSSVASIAKAEQMHSSTLRNVLAAAGLVNPKGCSGGSPIVVDYWKARDLIDATKHAMSFEAVGHALNSSRPVVVSLLELGVLTRVQGQPGSGSKLGMAIDGRSVYQVKQFIDRRIPLVDQSPDEFVDLAKASEKSRTKLKVILDLLFKGHLKKIVRVKNASGFASLRVLPDEIDALLDVPPDDMIEEGRFLIPGA